MADRFGDVGGLLALAAGQLERAEELVEEHSERDLEEAAVAAMIGQAAATLAVADRLDRIIELLFDEARPVYVRDATVRTP